MPIRVAKNIGFCFGVRRAVECAEELAKERNRVIYTYGELIHNGEVIDELIKKGIVPVNDLSELCKGDVLLIRSHGVPKAVFSECSERGIEVFDATCPFVKRIHKIVEKECKERQIIIVGMRNHPEVIGIAGNCEGACVVQNITELDEIELSKKVCVVVQTTFLRSTFTEITDEIKKRCDDVLIYDTTCDTTRKRQEEAEKLSRECDTMIVIGGKNSSNTRKLADICKKNCKNVLCIEKTTANTLENINFNDIIGLVAGASTPDRMIMEVLRMENHDNTTEQFGELLSSQEEVKIHAGKRVKGKVITATEEKIVVNLNYKEDGILYASEYSSPDMYEKVKPGDEIEVFIKAKDKDKDKSEGSGQVLLTTRRASSHQDRQRKVAPIFLTEDEQWKDKVFDAVVKDVVKKEEKVVGVSALVEGTRVFIPAAHLALTYVSDFDEYVGKTVQVKIISVTQKSGVGVSIVASVKELLLEQENEKKREAISKLEIGQKVNCKVIRVKDHAAILDLGDGISGYLPVRFVSWTHIESVADVFKAGQEIEAIVKDINYDKLYVTLSYKELTPKPWDNLEEKYPVGSIVEGKVIQIEQYVAVIQLEPGVKAFLHISQVALKHIDTIESEIKVGDTVRVKVTESNSQTKHISISRKEAIIEENPEIAAEIEREKEARARARQEQRENRERDEKQRRARQQADDTARRERREQAMAERRSRREEFDYTLPEEERSTTSLAGLFAGIKIDDSNDGSGDGSNK